MKTKEITFSTKIKEEIVTNEYPSIQRLKALLSSYIKITGNLGIRNKKSFLTLKTENAKIAKFIYQNINDLYNGNAHFMFSNKCRTKKTVYNILINENVDAIISDLDISFLENKISKNIVFNDDTISGYLAGAFLASGSINSPSTSNYHMEMSFNNENFAKWVSKLFGKYKNYKVEPKIAIRREKYVLYLKRSDYIAQFLVLIGAVSGCIEYENVRVDRDFANSANRLANSDTANYKKSLEAGQRQVEELKLIDKKMGIKNISNDKERELAFLRLENESASLLELAMILTNKYNRVVTKSAINHTFRSLHNLYLRLNHED